MKSYEEDVGVLNKPTKLSHEGVHQIVYCLSNGTKEIKDLLTNECDIIYECKVCRNLFRSLSNFLIHKRGFCKEHCCEKMRIFDNCDVPNVDNLCGYFPDSSSSNDICETNIENTTSQQSDNTELFPTKPPNSFTLLHVPLSHNLYSKQHSSFETCLDEISAKAKSNSPKMSLKLKKIPTNPNAVLQVLYNHSDDDKFLLAGNNSNNFLSKQQSFKTLDAKDKNNNIFQHEVSNHKSSSEKCKNNNYSRNQMKNGLDKPSNLKVPCDFKNQMKSVDRRKTNGAFTCKYLQRTDVAKILKNSNQCDLENLMCLVCDEKFANMNKLHVHMKSQHLKFQLRYPCSLCSKTFHRLINANKHMSVVHKRTKFQVEKLCKRALKNCFLQDGNKSASAYSYRCPHCGRSFSKFPSVINHVSKCKIAETFKFKKNIVLFSSVNLKNKTAKSVGKKAALSERNLKLDNKKSSPTIKKCVESKLLVNLSPPKNSNFYTSDEMEEKLDSMIKENHSTCTLCSKKLASKNNLKRHLAIHYGFYRFQCKYCSLKFYLESDARCHTNRQHPEKKQDGTFLIKLPPASELNC